MRRPSHRQLSERCCSHLQENYTVGQTQPLFGLPRNSLTTYAEGIQCFRRRLAIPLPKHNGGGVRDDPGDNYGAGDKAL